MVLAIARDAYFSVASATAGIFPSIGQVYANLAGLDPFTAAFGRTVKILGCGVLFEFLIPQPLKLVVEQAVNML